MRIGQAAEQNPIHHAEYCRGRANPHCQGGNNGDRENTIASEPSQCIAEVLPAAFEPHPAPDFPSAFLDQSRVAECPPSRVAGLFRGQAIFALLFLFQVQIGAQLPFEISAALPDLPPFHVRSPRRRATSRATASAVCFPRPGSCLLFHGRHSTLNLAVIVDMRPPACQPEELLISWVPVSAGAPVLT